jgi:hypothetical protein
METSIEDCCPPVEYSDELCIECTKHISTGQIPNHARKGYQYCSDCFNILFSPT